MAASATMKTFEQEVLASERPVIVDFWAPWCGPCRAVSPVLDQIAAERAGELKLVKVNVDDEPELAGRYGVSSIPAIVLFRGGKPVAGTVGAKPKWQLEKALRLSRQRRGNGERPGGGLRSLLVRLVSRR